MSGCEAKVPALRFKVTPAGNAEKAEGGRLPSNTGGRARTPVALWKRNRFGEIATRKSTMGNAVALPRVEYEDVIPFSGFFNNDIFAKPSDKIGVQFSEGDVLFGKLRPYLGNWILAEFKGLAVGDWWVLRPKGIDSEFLYTLIQSPSFQDVANQSSGSKMPRADWSLVSETFFSCPNDPVEQRRIGSLFRSLDALIAGREKSLDKLEALKKSMLLKMFPQGDATVPEVRFKGFAGDWEKKRLGEWLSVADNENRDGRFTATDVLSVSGDYGVVNQIEFQGRSFAGVSLKHYRILMTNQVVYTKSPLKRAPFGIVKANLFKDGIVSALYGVYDLVGSDSAFIQFYFESLPRLNNYFRPLVNKGAKNTLLINDEDAISGEVIFPSLPEQQKIGAYFRSLDALIAARREEIGKLKQMKKALLERMFV